MVLSISYTEHVTNDEVVQTAKGRTGQSFNGPDEVTETEIIRTCIEA